MSSAIGADETVVRVKGGKVTVGAAPDASTGETLGLDVPVERDADGFAGRLVDCAGGYKVDAMVADDLSAYKPVVNRLGVDRQICAAPVKKRARNRLDKTEGWEWVKARMRYAAASGRMSRGRTTQRSARQSEAR